MKRNWKRWIVAGAAAVACVTGTIVAEPFAAFNHAVGSTVGVTSNAVYRATIDGGRTVSIIGATNCDVFVGVNMTTNQFIAAIATTNVMRLPVYRTVTITHNNQEQWIDSLCVMAVPLSTGNVTWASW